MATVTLSAESKYGYSGQYIARITGRADRVQFARSFVGTRSGKRNDASKYETDEIGLYEECDVGKNGKSKSYALVMPWKSTLKKIYVDLDDALKIAKRFDGGESLDGIVCLELGEQKFVTEWYVVCNECGQECVANALKCGEHPDSWVQRKSREVPAVNADGTLKFALTYRIFSKAEAEKAEALSSVEAAADAIVGALAALPAPLQRKALSAVKARLFPSPPKEPAAPGAAEE